MLKVFITSNCRQVSITVGSKAIRLACLPLWGKRHIIRILSARRFNYSYTCKKICEEFRRFFFVRRGLFLSWSVAFLSHLMRNLLHWDFYMLLHCRQINYQTSLQRRELFSMRIVNFDLQKREHHPKLLN